MSTATSRFFRPDPHSVDQCEHRHRARFSARHIPASTVVVTVEGDIDATNDRFLATYVERQVAGSTNLVLDLLPVNFFGTGGFAALHNINVICSRHGIQWLLRVGPQIARLLTVCDPDRCLPVDQPQQFPLRMTGIN